MRTDREVDPVQGSEKLTHLVGAQRITSANGTVAGHRSERMLHHIPCGSSSSPIGDVIGDILEEHLQIDPAERIGDLLHRKSIATEWLDLKPVCSQGLSVSSKRLCAGCSELDHSRSESPLRSTEVLSGRLHQLVKHDSLVCSVLVDHHQLSRTLAEDVGVGELP